MQSRAYTDSHALPAASPSERAASFMQTAVVLCSSTLSVRYLNAAAEQLLRVPKRRAVDRPLAEFMARNDGLVTVLADALRQARPITQREVLLRRSPPAADVIVDCVATPTAANELLVELINVDRVIRQSRANAYKDLNAINRAVVQGLAHEVKNPLGGLRGAAQLLERELPDPRLREYTQVIIKEADRLRDLLDRMVGPGRPSRDTRVNVHEILEHVRTLVLAEAPESLRIDRDYDPSLPAIPGDFDALVQATLNVVLNAAQAVSHAGQVMLRTRVGRQLTIAGRLHRLVIVLEVIDNGAGIEPDVIDRIFYPMVSHRDGGSGLGLCIAQDIVNRHQGSIEVQSREGETRFSIYLPAQTT